MNTRDDGRRNHRRRETGKLTELNISIMWEEQGEEVVVMQDIMTTGMRCNRRRCKEDKNARARIKLRKMIPRETTDKQRIQNRRIKKHAETICQEMQRPTVS
jgi:hypothetical protein